MSAGHIDHPRPISSVCSCFQRGDRHIYLSTSEWLSRSPDYRLDGSCCLKRVRRTCFARNISVLSFPEVDRRLVKFCQWDAETHQQQVRTPMASACANVNLHTRYPFIENKTGQGRVFFFNCFNYCFIARLKKHYHIINENVHAEKMSSSHIQCITFRIYSLVKRMLM